MRNETTDPMFAVRITQDPLCYPPVNVEDDIFADEGSFAVRLREYIDFCIDELDPNDPTCVY